MSDQTPSTEPSTQPEPSTTAAPAAHPAPPVAPAPAVDPTPPVEPAPVLESAPPVDPAPADPRVPPAGADPWAAPADPEAPPADEAAPRRRPGAATVLRWTAAVLVLGLTGTATAFAVTAPERTSIPGLATPEDGRYAFAQLTLPPLPDGKPSPGASESGQRHYADLRELILPAPKGGVTVPVAGASRSPSATGSAAGSPSPSATGSPSGSASPSAAGSTAPDGPPRQPSAPWVPCADYAGLHDDTAHMPVLLQTNACRAATTRVWTAKDGTRTEIWLLRFGSKDEGGLFYDTLINNGSPKAVQEAATGLVDLVPDHPSSLYNRSTAKTGVDNRFPVGRVAYLGDGDVVATVLMTNPAGVNDQAFRQVVTLQSDLLG